MTIQHIDHIIYAATDVIEQLLGVRATYGGQHPNTGSHNALLSLTGPLYPELPRSSHLTK